MTAKHILELLRSKHEDDVFVPECKSGPTQNTKHRRLDAWVMKKSWASFNTIGYEIKVSRSDFLSDEKITSYFPLCNQLFVVCPAGVIKSADELPQGVGWMQVASTGNLLITKKRAQFREIDDPVMLYRYILMWRAVITDVGEKEDSVRYWKQWLENKKINYELGCHVSKALSEEIKKYAISMRKENEDC